MLLAIDVGNTETVIGLFGPGQPELARRHGLRPRQRTSAAWPSTGGSRRCPSARPTSTPWS